ncbi:sodium-dependent transporter [Aquibaculum sediminis]|uniref:sodium-dependent transporter n=1 Tax=Aquibaculum sediminis TaxID=3231907 RepID=UPI003455092E
MTAQPSPSQPPAAPREQWSTKTAFILATLGSAVGLGNIWRFSYVAGDNGGGAFLLVYLGAVLLLGLPLLLAEFSLGRSCQGDVGHAFRRAAPRSPLRHFGMLAVLGSTLILSYYSVIAGWTLSYLTDYLLGLLLPQQSGDHGKRFQNLIADPVEPLFWHFLFMAITVWVVMAGVRGGLERLSRLVMPLLGVTVVGLAIYAMSLPGSAAGVAFLLSPDWSALSDPAVYLAALGQAFFSLSLAMGVLVTYGGYLGREHRLPSAAGAVATGDVLFAIIAGLAIFPAVFAFGMAPAQGPVLAFVVLPQVFSTMPGGSGVALAFFFLLAAAALTSAVSLLEVPVAWAMRVLALSRRQATLLLGATVFLLGVPSSLGFGPWESVQLAGRGILDTIDHAVSNFLLPVAGSGLALLVGWVWSEREAIAEADLVEGFWARLWLILLRYIIPCAILLILLRSLGLL